MPTLSGTVKDAGGAFVAKLVRAYRRDNGAYVGSAISNATTGAWSITTADTSEHIAVEYDGNVDSKWGSVVLAMPLDKSLICLKGRSATAVGNASISGGYLVLDGVGDYVTLDGSATLAPGTGPFSISFRYTPNSIAADVALYDSRPVGVNGWYVALFATAGGGLVFMSNNVHRITSATGLLAVGVEAHIELDRDASGNWRAFIDGTQVGTTYADANNYLNGASRPVIGANGANLSASNVNGKFRGLICNSNFRNSANFTPPPAGSVGEVYGGSENALIYDRLVPV